MPEEKVTEEEVTEEKEASGKIDQVDSTKLVKLHALMWECVSLAREIVECEFGDLTTLVGNDIAEMTCDLAVALFHKASTPDQTETMLAALERGLEWFDAREEEQKAESARISSDFQTSMSAILPKPPRRATPLEVLMRSLIDFAARFSDVELTKLSDEVEEARETVTGGEVPTPEE